MTTSVRDTVRVFNKYLLNPAMLRLAGRKHWYAAAIRHTGRRSGKSYTTPVVADRVLTADRATIQVSGQTYEVAHPKIIDTVSAAPQLSLGRQRTFQRFGIDNFMKVELAPTGHSGR